MLLAEYNVGSRVDRKTVWVQWSPDDTDLEEKPGLEPFCCIQGDSNPHLDCIH